MSARDPAVVSLIDEIRADPRSRIFRFERRRASAPPRDPLVRPSATGLTATERELLSVHREEAALLLREAFAMRLAEDAAARTVYYRRFETPEPADWHARADQELALAARLDAAHGPAALLPLGRGERSPAELALASLRLADTDQGRIYCAQDLIHRGQCRSAERVLRHVLDRAPAPLHEWIAWQLVGLVHVRCDAPRRALEAYARAARVEGAGAEVLLNVFAQALATDSEGAALDAAARIEERLGADSPEVRYFLGLIEWTRRRTGGRTGAGPAAARLRSRLGPVAGGIADALS